MDKIINIYTDGSVVSNDGLFCGSGWAFIVPEKEIEICGKAYYRDESVPRLELTAVVEALKYIANNKGDYMIHCDNKSTVNCFKGFGARKLHKELWSEAHSLAGKIRDNGSTVRITFLDRDALDQKSATFKYAQTVDRLAYVQANSLEIV